MGDRRAQEPFLDELQDRLAALMPDRAVAARWAVAFSGGADSTVLLTALTRLGLQSRLAALHIDHATHPASGDWTDDCRRVAAELGVEFRSKRVSVDAGAGRGFEAAAREVRYAALGELLAPDEVLLTAHHADDQLETLLLRMLRGSGVTGLGAIAPLRQLAGVNVGRPLLGFSRAQILEQAECWGLDWLEDPGNADPVHDRNFLRAEIVPRLTARWPAASRTAARLAGNMREADGLLEELAMVDLGQDASSASIDRERLRGFVPARQRNALRVAIRARGLPVPSASQLEELRRSLSVTRPDARTAVTWPGAEARVYRDRLYLLEPLAQPRPHSATARLAPNEPWEGVEGRLVLAPGDTPGLPDAWVQAGLEVRFRRGGERFKPLNRGQSRPLKSLFQEAGIVPWMRGRVPLIYRGDMIAAVGDLWTNDAARGESACGRWWRVTWTDHPPIH